LKSLSEALISFCSVLEFLNEDQWEYNPMDRIAQHQGNMGI